MGGDGVDYHDTDTVNDGCGPYNNQPGHCDPYTEYIAYFRVNQGADLTNVKEFLDFDYPNPFKPDRGQQFIGWTKDNESCNYTVDVLSAGIYQVGILYSNKLSNFKLLLNNRLDREYVGKLKTGRSHTLNFDENIGTVSFEKKTS